MSGCKWGLRMESILQYVLAMQHTATVCLPLVLKRYISIDLLWFKPNVSKTNTKEMILNN